MSHSPERKEKDCLNCGTRVHGRFCHVCGQENTEPKESFWGMVSHFFNDITHFDGKFFTSLKYLFLKPGFLSKEYIRGRRASYLHPVRMYVFTSALFFLIFFSMRKGSDMVTMDDTPFTPERREQAIKELEEEIAQDSSANLIKQVELLRDTTREIRLVDLQPYWNNFQVISPIGGKYKTMREYDSIEAARPPGERDGWIKKQWNKRAITLNEKYKNDKAKSYEFIMDAILHKLPYLLFVSLPLFALLLKLLYFRRKQFYYADHGIFSIHHYVVTFLLVLLAMIWSRLNAISDLGIWNLLSAITSIAVFFYLYMGMKRFYGQGGFKTFIKFLLLCILGLIVVSILFVLFSLFSIFQL